MLWDSNLSRFLKWMQMYYLSEHFLDLNGIIIFWSSSKVYCGQFSCFILTLRLPSGVLTDADLDMITLSLFHFSHYPGYGCIHSVSWGCMEQDYPHQLWDKKCFSAGKMLSHNLTTWFIGPNVVLTCHMPSDIRCIKWRTGDRTELAPYHQEEMQLRQTRSSPSLVGHKPNKLSE